MTIRFDKAWENVRALADRTSRDNIAVVLVRDVLGRLSLVLDDSGGAAAPDGLHERIVDQAGPFAGSRPVFPGSEMFSAQAVLDSPTC